MSRAPTFIQLAGFRGQSPDAVQENVLAGPDFPWTATKEELGESVEMVAAKLEGLKDDPSGVPLQVLYEGAGGELEADDNLYVEILEVTVHEDEQRLVVTLRPKQDEG